MPVRVATASQSGEPATASYGTLHFGQNNKIDDGKTEFVSAGSTDDASTQVPPPSGAHGAKSTQLTLGLILPKTGAVAYLGPPMFAGAHLAVKEINAAGGILGKPVVALCGKVWVPGRDPKRFPVCPACKAIYEGLPRPDDDD